MKVRRSLVYLVGVASTACNLSTPARFRPDASTECAPVYIATSAAVVDDECGFEHCTAAFEQTGCDLRITWRGCTMLPEHGVIDKSGSVSFDTMTGVGQCTGNANVSEPVFRMSCTSGCTVDAYTPPFRSIATVQAITVDSALALSTAGTFDPLIGFAPLQGYISGAAIVGDRVLVVATVHNAAWDAACTSSPPLEIVAFDRKTMLETARSSAPACLTELVADTDGRGFFGLYGGQAPRIGFFDAQAQLVRSASIAVPMGTNMIFTTGILRADDGATIFAALDIEGRDAMGAAYDVGFLAAFAAADLAPGPTATFAQGIRAVSFSDEGLIAVSPFYDNEIRLFDPVGLASRDSFMIPDKPAFHIMRAGAMTLHRTASRMLIASTGDYPTVNIFTKRMLEGWAQYYEAPATPWAGAIWPLDQDLAVIGVTLSDRTAAARIALFDRQKMRFLPGSTEVGVGVVQQILTDADGDLWIVLPWSGTIARAHPIPR
jgi:hypothetical protein